LNTTSFIELEKKGIAALNQKKNQEAVELFEKITQISPEYEHGMGFYNLACSLEEVGEINRAQKAYEEALFYLPDDRIRMGGYASFLYLHGNAREAFEAYLKLLKIYIKDNDSVGILGCRQALHSLGHKMGWNSDEVINVIKINETFIE
jgi:tetratricopeptide (TPR) repeat protein